MTQFMVNNLASIIIGAAVLAILTTVTVKLVKDRKKGKCSGSCGCNCACEGCKKSR